MIRRYARALGAELAETALIFVAGAVLLGVLFAVAFAISIGVALVGGYTGLNPVLVFLGLLLLLLAGIIIYRSVLRATNKEEG